MARRTGFLHFFLIFEQNTESVLFLYSSELAEQVWVNPESYVHSHTISVLKNNLCVHDKHIN